jgi:putative hydrolase
MIRIIADTHIHTVASEHAYSTVLENLTEAKKKGLRFLCFTDHAGRMVGAPSDAYFACLRVGLPDAHDGVNIIRGCEVNILDENGTLDLPLPLLDQLEWVIASVHGILTKPMSIEQSTKMWLNIAQNPHVDVIGHCGDENYRFDYEQAIPAFAKHGKIVEINAASYRSRPTSVKNCVEIARLCAKHGVPLVLSSDAHFAGNVGEVSDAIRIFTEAGVPVELILNANADRFAERLTEMTGRRF